MRPQRVIAFCIAIFSFSILSYGIHPLAQIDSLDKTSFPQLSAMYLSSVDALDRSFDYETQKRINNLELSSVIVISAGVLTTISLIILPSIIDEERCPIWISVPVFAITATSVLGGSVYGGILLRGRAQALKNANLQLASIGGHTISAVHSTLAFDKNYHAFGIGYKYTF